jgi:hypothetical protein
VGRDGGEAAWFAPQQEVLPRTLRHEPEHEERRGLDFFTYCLEHVDLWTI